MLAFYYSALFFNIIYVIHMVYLSNYCYNQNTNNSIGVVLCVGFRKL